jgi:hypothetical protein
MIKMKPESKWLNRVYYRSVIPGFIKIGQVAWALHVDDR